MEGAETMRIFHGTVKSGYGVAAANLRPVLRLIELRMGMAGLVEGTLNIQIPESYLVIPTTSILPHEYPLNLTSGLNETIKLQRCVIGGHQATIMRPANHQRDTCPWAKNH